MNNVLMNINNLLAPFPGKGGLIFACCARFFIGSGYLFYRLFSGTEIKRAMMLVLIL